MFTRIPQPRPQERRSALPPAAAEYIRRNEARVQELSEDADRLLRPYIGDTRFFGRKEVLGREVHPLQGYRLAIDEGREVITDPAQLRAQSTANAVILDFGGPDKGIILNPHSVKNICEHVERYAQVQRDLTDPTKRFTDEERRNIAGEAEVERFHAFQAFTMSLENVELFVKDSHKIRLAQFLTRLYRMPPTVFYNEILLPYTGPGPLEEEDASYLEEFILQLTGVAAKYSFIEEPLDGYPQEDEEGYEPGGHSVLLMPPGTPGVLKRMVQDILPEALKKRGLAR